jgi:hypothetical protein
MNESEPHIVSVIIPCYNHAHFLGEAIMSVLQQTYKDYEILVIDDGSPDATSEVAARFPAVRYVRQTNQGLSAARNRGIREARGEYLVFLDADDRLLPRALEIGVRDLQAHPQCAFVYGRCQYINDRGLPIATTYRAPVFKDHYLALLQSNYIWMPAQVMYRAAVFGTVGGFNPAISAAADYELYLKITRQFPVHNHHHIIAEYRQHIHNMSRDHGLMLKTTLTALGHQRKFVARDKRYLTAYRAGKQTWQSYYGEGCVEQLRANLRRPERRPQVWQALLTLLHYYPQGVARHLFKKIKLTFRQALGLRSAPGLKKPAEE